MLAYSIESVWTLTDRSSSQSGEQEQEPDLNTQHPTFAFFPPLNTHLLMEHRSHVTTLNAHTVEHRTRGGDRVCLPANGLASSDSCALGRQRRCQVGDIRVRLPAPFARSPVCHGGEGVRDSPSEENLNRPKASNPMRERGH